MNKLVSLINWVNNTAPAINDSNLNKMDRELNGLDDRIITLDTSKLDKTTAYEMVKSITYNEANGVFTVTYLNGTTSTLDTKLEKLAVNFEYDAENERLVITLSDGTKQYVDLKSLITEYEFQDSSTIDFSVVNGKVKADIIDGSITGDKLQPNYLADCQTASESAGIAAESAQSSAVRAENAAERAEGIVGITIATTEKAGIVKPDGKSISVKADGTITANYSNPNLLDNPFFTVNQRGQSEYPTSIPKTYTVDRWNHARSVISVGENGVGIKWDGVNGSNR